jgi:hypothetical protein
MVWDRRVTPSFRIEPDFMATRGLPVKLKPKSLESSDDLATAKSRKPAHLSANNKGRIERLAYGMNPC